MNAWLLTLAWLFSCAPFALARLLSGETERFAGLSHAALAALAWMACAGAPGRVGHSAGFARPLRTSALALPPLALGVALDRAQGLELAFPLQTAALALGVVFVLELAASRVAASQRATTLYALAWFTLLALPPAAWLALERIGAPLFGHAPRWLDWLASSGPIGWCLARVDPARAHASFWLASGALMALALLVAAAGVVGTRLAEGERA